nr:CDC42 small effector protein 2-like isoform X2 [Dermatophagoides farinae]XP_046920264.1 CDC42 small effector protein 2-like isoform X2 [Dermatophagoides farinae]XP_046920265.1 CDC42 small effector protein 2-like isoform X2 [Dermatophagoides farinae]
MIMNRFERIMSELWIQCFTCGIVANNRPQTTRRRIDRSMIGNPTNFRHTAHVGGSGDMSNHIRTIQNQMASKGGYDYAMPVKVSIPVVDVKN